MIYKSNYMKRAIKKLVESILGAPPISDNFNHNKWFWNRYVKRWNKKTIITDKNCDRDELNIIGEEWGDNNSVDEIVKDYITPYINNQSVVCELGSGGGRIASKVAPQVKELHCLDISNEFLKVAKNHLKDYKNIHYTLLNNSEIPKKYKSSFDFIFSFDVFLHFDLYTIYNYLKNIHSCLKPSSHTFIHTANLSTESGWKTFLKHENLDHCKHNFITPETFKILSNKAGFEIIKASTPNKSNFYLDRDYLVILKKV